MVLHNPLGMENEEKKKKVKPHQNPTNQSSNNKGRKGKDKDLKRVPPKKGCNMIDSPLSLRFY